MKALVVDGSMMLSLVIEDERTSASDATYTALSLPRSLPVPAHWWIEISNGLLMAERRKRISRAGISEAVAYIRNIPVVFDGETSSRATSETLEVARQYQLTTYDAAYLELAIRTHAVLATLDKALARAAEAAGVELLKPSK